MGEHEVAVLIESDELLIGPDECRLGNAALLPMNFAAARIHGREDGRTAFAAARKINRVADAHGIAVVQAQAIGAPQLLGYGRETIALQFDDLGSRAVLGRDEQQVVGTPYRGGDADAVIGAERYLPLQVSVVRIYGEYGPVHHSR